MARSSRFSRIPAVNENRVNQLQVLRDLYLVHRSVEFSESDTELDPKSGVAVTAKDIPAEAKPKLSIRIRQYFSRYGDLVSNPRLRNSTISSCTVALGQQLCGSM